MKTERTSRALRTGATALLATALASGCATTARVDPALLALQSELQRLRADPRIAPNAAAELRDAEIALGVIDADQRRMNPEELDQALYLGDRLLDIAEAEGLARHALERGRQLDLEREQLLAEARSREAAIARAEAERARIRAEEARLSTQLALSDAERARRQAEYERQLAERGLRSAELARQEAERARIEAEQARQALQAMQSELADLQARQTERGLVVTIGDVLFEVDRAELKPGAERELDKLVTALRDHDDFNVLIEGHTDSTGSASYNQSLSERRAAAVRSYLGARGISPERLEAIGLGQQYPVASNDTAAGRQQNRRVEIVIQDPDTPRVGTLERE